MAIIPMMSVSYNMSIIAIKPLISVSCSMSLGLYATDIIGIIAVILMLSGYYEVLNLA